jgi:zinc/manganese transport system permease protein
MSPSDPHWQEIWTLMAAPLAAAILLPGLLVYYGLHILQRGIIFVDLALAQVATLGTCVCVLLGHEATDIHAYLWSLGFTMIGALLFTYLREPTHGRVPLEALIGIVYVVAAATTILLLSHAPHGREELQKTLVGDLLTVSWPALGRMAALYACIGAVHWIWRRSFLQLSFDRTHAEAAGLPVRRWDFCFYFLFGLLVTTFVHLGGVLLVFSYLIIPAVCGRLFTGSLSAALLIGWGVAILGGLSGLAASYQLDVPGGAAVVCMLGFLLAASSLITALLRSYLHTPPQDAATPRS